LSGAPYTAPRYVSLELEELLWRSRQLAVLSYRPLHAEVVYPPATFSLLWVPGHEAVPLTPVPRGKSLIYIVRAVGPVTRRLVEKPPRYVGAIGPLGSGWRVTALQKLWLHIADGSGLATALSVLQAATPAVLAYGARSGDELVPLEDLGLIGGGVDLLYAAPLDGSQGGVGSVVSLAEQLVEERGVDALTAAGSRHVICGAARVAEKHGIKAFLAPEARVRCGLGFCGKCSLSCSGRLLCRDGLYLDRGVLGCWLASSC